MYLRKILLFIRGDSSFPVRGLALVAFYRLKYIGCICQYLYPEYANDHPIKT